MVCVRILNELIDDLELFLLDNGLTDEFVKWRRERDEKRKM